MEHAGCKAGFAVSSRILPPRQVCYKERHFLLLPWRGSPEEGRRSGFDSHEFNGRRSLHRVRLPDGISKLFTRSDNDDQRFDVGES
jgi:hypothetical protein